jgi:ectoine hydroxylase-related dioxygenase (phytanoyl-CoA dioxygenase family)
MIRRFVPSDEESKSRAFSSETIDEATRCVRSAGAVILDGIVDAALVEEARKAFAESYARYLTERKHDDALEVGDKRIMVTINFEPPFDQSDFFANSWIMPLLRAIFEDGFLLGGYTVVCSLPGARTQHRHRDGGILFPQSQLDRLLPTAAVTVAIPLLEMNDVHGTTELWLGSHRDSDHVVEPTAVERGAMPIVSEGSCILWDYRLIHGGTPNRSPVPRPLLCLTYCRPWFLDHLNYGKQPLLSVPKDWLATLPEEHQRLLARATAHWLPAVLP